MNIDSFFQHYGIQQNPFDAEEARLDPIFDRLKHTRLTHPDFAKILGQPEHASTAVVFGEKGSGKTAIRLLMERRIREHNQQHPDRRVLVVDYDDLNPVLDKIMRSKRQDADSVLRDFRLADHQDAILSRAVTRLVNALLGETPPGHDPLPLPENVEKTVLRRLSKQNRIDLAVLAALYDQPRTGSVADRWKRLRQKLRLGWRLPAGWLTVLAAALTVVALALLIGWALVRGGANEAWWLTPAMGLTIAAAVLAWGYAGYRQGSLWLLSRRIRHETPAVERSGGELRQMLGDLSPREIARQPFPVPSKEGDNKTPSDARYQLTRRLVDLLHPFGYVGMMVLVDRVDEPTLVSGDAQKMKSIVWPMFDNKFLQQEGVGVKLLLPIELRHLLHRESPAFYQEARLDKQNMIDRLTWSGATLYDLASARLRACRGPVSGSEFRVSSPDSGQAGDDDTLPSRTPESETPDSEREPGNSELKLTDLFEPAVTREMIVDALDQMHQPRDAFKFLYQVIQEHCRLVPEDAADFQIARLTLESVRRAQSQRVQELYRGLTPA